MEYLKSQLSPQDFKIVQGLGLNLDSKVLAEMWPDYVNFEKRWETEVPFLLGHFRQLRGHPKIRVLDAAAGTGVTSIGLKRAGIEDIVSNEIDDDFRAVAVQQARKYGVELTFTQHDWRALPDEWTDTFDAVVCLGNSLTYLFKEEDITKSLQNFKRVLKPGGQLHVDERNYDAILSGRYNPSGEVVYCGLDKVDAMPFYISPSMVVLELTHKETGKTGHIVVNPFKGPTWPELPAGAFSEDEERQLVHALDGIQRYVAQKGLWLRESSPQALDCRGIAKKLEDGQTLTVTCTSFPRRTVETKLEIGKDNLSEASCRLVNSGNALQVVEVGGGFYRYTSEARQAYLESALSVVNFLTQMHERLQRQ